MDYDDKTKAKLLEYLMEFVTEERKKRFSDIIQYRTRHITVVLEDIYQPHNASAVLRTCDLNGIQDVHIIENKNVYDVNPEVALGSSKWLTLKKYNSQQNNTLDTLNSLKSQGYKIVATTPHKDSHNLDTLDLNDKVALVFGTELTGLSEVAIKNSDEYLKIPMHGFTESYNISVSAALCMFTLTQRMRKENIDWKLSESEYTDILLEWARNSLSRHESMEKHFLKGF